MAHDTGIRIRALRDADRPALRDVFRRAVEALGPEHYLPNQVTAWAGFASDVDAFDAWLGEASTSVATDTDGTILGFAALKDRTHIAALYVAPEAARRGVGTALLWHTLEEAAGSGRKVLTTSASACSRPLFERVGFRVSHVERTDIAGVAFERYAMRLDG